METAITRLQNASAKSKMFIGAFDDLPPTDTTQLKPMFSQGPPPYLTNYEQARYRQEWDSLVAGLNDPPATAANYHPRSWLCKASRARKVLWELWFASRSRCRDAGEMNPGPDFSENNLERLLFADPVAALAKIRADAAANAARHKNEHSMVYNGSDAGAEADADLDEDPVEESEQDSYDDVDAHDGGHYENETADLSDDAVLEMAGEEAEDGEVIGGGDMEYGQGEEEFSREVEALGIATRLMRTQGFTPINGRTQEMRARLHRLIDAMWF